MWTPNGPQDLKGRPLKGKKRNAPRFKVGDRVLLWTGPSSSMSEEDLIPGTITDAPKTSAGRYTIEFDEVHKLYGRIEGCHEEDLVDPADDRVFEILTKKLGKAMAEAMKAKTAKAGK